MLVGSGARDGRDDHGGPPAVIPIGLDHQGWPALPLYLALGNEWERHEHDIPAV